MKKNMKASNLRLNIALLTMILSTSSISLVVINHVKASENSDIVRIEFEQIDQIEDLDVLEIEKVESDSSLDDALVLEEEGLDETLDDIYSGMMISNDYEHYIKEICNEYAIRFQVDPNFLFETVLTIGDQESDGKWDNTSKVSSTNDYGDFQINIINHKEINEALGYTSKDLKDDPYKNAEAAVWMVCGIMANKNCKNIEDVFGMYNGWVDWEKKTPCVEYVNSCMERYNNYFSEKESINRM